ncbi:PREDICTED: putative RING-H2 finger protein ATL12 [Erythranthe guttata]|nr:PREDICTED: putative RING-H2 finger protein ATL12 [Erythranthe guttata]|eukprot:XP_012845423.1 PREDICTED: putative RING-H2 finger protein ATL12 [Erythranthe guttata]
MDEKSTTTTILLSIISILFFVISAINDVTAQNQLAVKPSPPQADDDSATNFQPSLAVVIALLSIMFSLTIILLLYAKFRRRRRSSSSPLSRRIIQDGLLRRPSPPPSGVDKSVIESLPLFRFSSLRGPAEGLECAVCLAQFDGTDVLRMLPKCKHAFHIDCIDRWLEKRDTCPLCRCRAEPNNEVGSDPQCSEGFPWDPPDHHGYSNLELYVEREEYSSSFGSKPQEEEEEEGLSMQINNTNTNTDNNNNRDRIFHKLNHKINVIFECYNVLKNRWSDVSSSDMLYLNSEMLADVSDSRFLNSCNLENNSRKNHDYSMMNNIKEEMERKRVFESKVKEIKNHTRIVKSDYSTQKRDGLESDMRSVSEIKVHPRLRDLQLRNSGNSDLVDEEEVMRRRVWLQIARRTIQWFANREEPRPSTQINV